MTADYGLTGIQLEHSPAWGITRLLSTPPLAAHLDQILAGQPRHLVFDLARVSFIDCATARLIAGTDAFLPDDHRPVVRRAAPQVRRVFELTGLDVRCEMAGETG